MHHPTASRLFTLVDQHRFADLTGDHNPVHVDPVAARRVGSGVPIVHGVHNLLWCLDLVAPHCPPQSQVAELKADFGSFLSIDEPAEMRLLSVEQTRLRAEVRSNGLLVLVVVLSFGAHRTAADAPLTGPLHEPRTPRTPSMQDMATMQGTVPYATAADTIADAFPGAARLIGAHRVAALGACTRLIGMVCPGLHSYFNRLALEATDRDRPVIAFQVASADFEHRHIRLAVSGGGWTGTLTASVRPEPTGQPTMCSLRGMVAPNEFADRVGLVVGGSRGLGEVAAKLIACGGGHPIITYAHGVDDAARVVADIRTAGGRCDMMRLDVQQGIAGQLADLPAPPSHLLYFASPMITRRSAAVFDAWRHALFTRFYVEAFHECCLSLLAQAPDGLTALYPSTVFVDAHPPGLTEYAMAKAAGEVLCAALTRGLGSFRGIVARLPRLATDQNPGLSAEAGVADTLLPLVRDVMHPRS